MRTISGRLFAVVVVLLAAVSAGVGILYSSVTRSLYIKEQCRIMEEVYNLLLEQDISALCESENRGKTVVGEDELEEQSGSFLEPYENSNLRFRIRDENFHLLYATNKSLETGSEDAGQDEIQRRIAKYEENARAKYEKKGGRVVLRGAHVQGDDTFYIMITQSSYVVNRSTDYGRRVLFLVIAVILTLGTVCVRILAASIGRPVENAVRVAQKIADKDFSEKLEEHTKYRELNELGESINEMARQIQSYIRDLETYNQLLQEDNQRRAELEHHRKQFVNNVSHELKTPLAIISGQLELLSLSRDEQKRQDYCRSAMEEIERMNDMVSSMLQIFAVEEGLERLPMERMELGRTAEAAFEEFAPLFTRKQIQAEFQKTQDCMICGNPENIRRAVNNFLMNAYRYTPTGGRVKVSVDQNGRYAILSVYNNGGRVAEKDVVRIWDSFYQGSGIGRQSEEGTGLGLYLVKNIVAQHGGVCGLENQEDGVEFWFGIPLETRKDAPASGTPDVTEQEKNTQKSYL